LIFDAGLYREQLQEIYELFRSYTLHQALDDYINVDHEYYPKNSDRRKVLEKYIFEAKKTIIGDNQKTGIQILKYQIIQIQMILF
jgi:hypothetical protein